MKGLSILLILQLIWVTLSQNSRSRRNEHSPNDFVNQEVRRKIDLTNNIIKIETNLIIKLQKEDSVSTYRFPLLKNHTTSLIFLKASLKSADGKEEVPNIKISKLSRINDPVFDFYEINFKSEPMNQEEERLLTIREEYFGRLDMLPKRITLKENQYVLFRDSINHVSYYTTTSQNLEVKLPDRSNIISFTEEHSSRGSDSIFYNQDESVESLKFTPLRIHYENNRPLVVFNQGHKIFEVSHWGNIAIEERYQLENVGALLDGEFGRVDYDHGRTGGKNALRSIHASLPLRSHGLWYRDEIGNISTSKSVRNWDDVGMDLSPRFPILGGWKSNFVIGYNLPSKFSVSVEEENVYSLKLSLGTPFEDILAKNYTVSVALPEGASILDVKVPIESIYSISYSKYFSFLDLFGRPMININVKNAYDIHKVHFEVRYTFSFAWMLLKPALLVSFFLLIFATLIISFRVNISLSSSDIKVKID